MSRGLWEPKEGSPNSAGGMGAFMTDLLSASIYCLPILCRDLG